jgi:hypothetical protein
MGSAKMARPETPMMRSLPFVFLLAAAAPAQQSWTNGTIGQASYELGGELRFRGELRDTANQATGLGGADENLDVRAAVEFGMVYDRYISGRFRAFATATDAVGSDEQDIELAVIDLDHLFGDYHISFGRMQLDLADERLVSSNPWLYQQNSFDGIMVGDSTWNGDWQLWYTQAATGPAEVDDNSFAGAFFSPPSEDDIEFYILRRGDGATDLLEWTYAIRWAGETSNGLEWSALGAFQDGRDRSLEILSTAFVVNLAKRLDYGHNVAVELAWAQGNDERATDRKRFDPVYINQHRYNGRADIVAFSNLVDLGFFYWLDWNERWSFHVDYHDFTRQSNLDDIYLGVEVMPVTTASANNDIGGELDVYAEGRISEAVMLDVGVSHFSPGAAMPHDEDQLWFFLDVSLYF